MGKLKKLVKIILKVLSLGIIFSIVFIILISLIILVNTVTISQGTLSQVFSVFGTMTYVFFLLISYLMIFIAKTEISENFKVLKKEILKRGKNGD